MKPEQRQSGQTSQDVAVIVDDRGDIQAQFGGMGALQDANLFLKDVQTGGVRHLRGASVVTGLKAHEAIRKGHI